MQNVDISRWDVSCRPVPFSLGSGWRFAIVGRVYIAQTGRLIAQHTFSTPIPEISWNSYSEAYVSFSKGDGGDDSVYISLPPSFVDRMLAARPHL